MTTPELISFVKRELAVGETKEAISLKLKTQGWTEFDIIETFNSILQIPAPTSVIHPTAYASVQAKPQRSHIKFVIFAVILLVIIAGGALAYASGYIVPLKKISKQSLQAIEDKMITEMDMNVTVDLSGIKDINKEQIPGMTSTFTMNVKGAVDATDEKNPKSDMVFSFTSGKVEAGFNVRVLNQIAYMELTKAPNIGFISLEPFTNKWVSVPYEKKDLKSNPLLSSTGITTQSFKDLTDEQKQHIKDLTDKAQFIKITGKHLPDMIDGSPAFHFDFELDKEGMKAYLKEMVAYIKTIDTENIYNLSSVTDSDYDKIFNALESFHGEAWIGIFNHLPYKVTMVADVQNPDAPGDGSVKINATLFYKNWNKPVTVVAPPSSTTVEELMASVMGGMTSEFEAMPDENLVDDKLMTGNPLEDARMKATFAKIRSIHDSFRSQAELYYETNKNSYKGFCGNKGANGAYQLATTLPENSVYRCNDSQTEWAAWTKLPDNKYWCSDSTGASKSVSGGPKGTSCSK